MWCTMNLRCLDFAAGTSVVAEESFDQLRKITRVLERCQKEIIRMINGLSA